MSVTESKTKTERKSSRKPAKTQETVLSALLAQTEEVSVSLASLIKSPLNVRTVPYSAESVSELAESLRAWTVQNLVSSLPGDRRCRRRWSPTGALNMLAERGIFRLTGLSGEGIPQDWRLPHQ
ncbi:putative parB-like partition protein [Escherichia coli BCE011_MS-01]|nr:putative parB-like partition protein [Escherichia coli BCE011_MS-01]